MSATACAHCGADTTTGDKYTLVRGDASHDACSRPCLAVLDQRLSETGCARDECRNRTVSGHIYCTPQCKQLDAYWAAGAATMMLTSTGADRLARVRRNLALVPGDQW